jgi:hypothetical protein
MIENKTEKTKPIRMAATTDGGFQPIETKSPLRGADEKTNPFTADLCTRDAQIVTRNSLNRNASKT